MPSSSGENRRRKPKSDEPRFLRKAFLGHGRGAPAKVLRILGWAVALWFVSVIFLGDTGLVSILRMRSMRESLERDISGLEQVKAATEERKADLANDPWVIETVAREEYGMIRDGEICYRVYLGESESDE